MSVAAELLGILAYHKLVAFERLAADAQQAPVLADKLVLAQFADAAFHGQARVYARLEQLVDDPNEVIERYRGAIDAFGVNMAPKDWLEGLAKTYVADGLVNDFFHEVAAMVDPDTAEVFIEVTNDGGHAPFAIERLRRAIEGDQKVAGRMALYGRRLMGELISQAVVVASTQQILTDAFAADAVDLPSLLNAITVGHTRRMDALGLAS